MTLKNKILELRNKNYSYSQIQKELNCSKATICYYCGSNQKEKTRNRSDKNRKTLHPLVRKIESFKAKYTQPKNKISKNNTLNRILKLKIEAFSREHKKQDYNNMSFTIKEFLEKVGDNPTCALTGRPIDLMNSKSYQLDHIIPRSKGGDNSLKNCRLTCKQANIAKSDMTDEEFIQLCKDVINHVNKK
jgi:5-methylcytosine-specific restriction endonuclease McrA